MPADDNQRFIDWESEDFIHCEQFSFSNAAGFPVFRRVIGNAPGAKLFGLAGDLYADFAGTVA